MLKFIRSMQTVWSVEKYNKILGWLLVHRRVVIVYRKFGKDPSGDPLAKQSESECPGVL